MRLSSPCAIRSEEVWRRPHLWTLSICNKHMHVGVSPWTHTHIHTHTQTHTRRDKRRDPDPSCWPQGEFPYSKRHRWTGVGQASDEGNARFGRNVAVRRVRGTPRGASGPKVTRPPRASRVHLRAFGRRRAEVQHYGIVLGSFGPRLAGVPLNRCTAEWGWGGGGVLLPSQGLCWFLVCPKPWMAPLPPSMTPLMGGRGIRPPKHQQQDGPSKTSERVADLWIDHKRPTSRATVAALELPLRLQPPT